MTPPATTHPTVDPEIDPVIEDALRDVFDPCCRDKGISVVDMGLLHRTSVDDGTARVELLLTSGWCPFASQVLTDIAHAVEELPGVDRADVEIVWDEVWSPQRLSDSARSKLRFLPDPTDVADPRAYVAQNWPAAPADETRGGDR